MVFAWVHSTFDRTHWLVSAISTIGNQHMQKGKMKLIIRSFFVILLSSSSWGQNVACEPNLTGFVCKDQNGKIITNRCGTNRNAYDLKENGTTLRCSPTGLSSDFSKKSLIELVKKQNETNLKRFKTDCNFSSPLNIATDPELQDTMKLIANTGGTLAIRALIFSESHCADPLNHEVILSWIGNELLINHAADVMKAFSQEQKNQHLYEIAQMEPNEWRGTECVTNSCRMKRNTWLVSKINSIESSKIEKNIEPIRVELLRTLKKVNDSAKHEFLMLTQQPDENHLNLFKKKCTLTSPVDFIGDQELFSASQNILKSGNPFLIRALIYVDDHCADVTNRKSILSWLGNEILISHAENLIIALSKEDQKHELYDIAEIENKEWRETKCFDDPCSQNRKDYFSSKRRALENAKVDKKIEPVRRQLLKYLISDQ